MYIPLGIKSDYSLLKSLVKIKDLIEYLKKHNITACGLVDDHLFGVMEFYNGCKKNGIKPIIGLDVVVNDKHVYLYAMNYEGYLSLLKLNTLKQERDLGIVDLKNYNYQVLCIIPYNNKDLYKELVIIYDQLYIGYTSSYEKNNALIITDKIVFVNEVKVLEQEDIEYIDYLSLIKDGKTINELEKGNYEKNYLLEWDDEEDESTTRKVSELLNVEIPFNNRYIPQYPVKDSYDYLVGLAKKGLSKRLNGKVSSEYIERLKYELSVIKSMGFVDYFLIVYDYVKYAKNHDVLVGPGRGSAAGSLVSYVLGITNVDPLEYDLLFERFLNPDRITMPDIDIDFEFTKRESVIDYVKEKYGQDKVAAIMTYGTLAAKQVVRDVAKTRNIDLDLVDKFAKRLDAKLSLKDNAKIPQVRAMIKERNELVDVYRIAMKLEGIKRHVSTHAAGVVISSKTLDEVIPIYKSNEVMLTGLTMEYLEDLGLLKMDFLALRNLTIIKNVLDLIKQYSGEELNLSSIPLDDRKTLDLFKTVDTEGIFQFESSGMKSFLQKLQVESFSDVVAAIALFRPGPMENIDIFIARKNGKMKIIYPDPSLEPILKDTYGIMIYQEQIMQVLVTMANYSFAEADNIRRAMSKKKKDIMESERDVFVTRSVANGYSKQVAMQVYDLIIKFANYGFNKAHSVSYALIGYQMAYLKSRYPIYFMANLLNMSVNSEIKTKDYILEAKKKGIEFYRPDINLSTYDYGIQDNKLIMPFSVIKSVGYNVTELIVSERISNGEFTDYLNFIVRAFKIGIGRKIVETLIKAGVLDSLGLNRKTMIFNLDDAFNYAELCNDLDESLVLKPVLVEHDEYDSNALMTLELELFGFYVTNHPASKYNGDDIIKVSELPNHFDKYVKMVVMIADIKKIKTKQNQDMAFVTAGDETGLIDYIIFPRKSSLLNMIKRDKLYVIYGQVTRKNYDYQIVVSNILEV